MLNLNRFFSRLLCTHRYTRGSYSEEELLFYIQSRNDYVRVQRCVESVRRYYKTAQVMILADGDPDPRIENLCSTWQATYVYRDWAAPLKNGGQFLKQMLQLFLETHKNYLIRLDTDTLFHRRMDWIPVGHCVFGTIQRYGTTLSIQGGFVGFTRSAAVAIAALPEEAWTSLLNFEETWCRGLHSVAEEAKATGLVRTDWLIAYMVKKAKAFLQEFPEVLSCWKNIPRAERNEYAATHPHKQ